MNKSLSKRPTDYFNNVQKLSPSEVERRRIFISKWSEDYSLLIQYVMGLKNNFAKGIAHICKGVRTQSSPFHDIETELYNEFVVRKKGSQKVSATWIQINGKKIYETLKISNPENGKVSSSLVPMDLCYGS